MRIAIGLCVFALAASPVRADSGWILWQVTEATPISRAGSSPSVGDRNTRWEPQEGFEAFALCRGAAAGALQGAVEVLKSTGAAKSARINPGGGSATLMFEEGSQMTLSTLRFVCFPGVFDPRGRAE